VCLICDEFRKRRDLADARRMLLAARREPRSIDRAHLDKLERDLDEYEAKSKSSGMTILELVVTVAILGVIGFTAAVWWKQQQSNDLYLRARSVSMEDTDRIFNGIRKAWDSRDRNAPDGGFTMGTAPALDLTVSMKPKGGVGLNATANWQTQCRPLPSRLGLSPAQSASIASLAQISCGIVCSAGERPVIVETRTDNGAVPQQVPSDTSGAARESLLGLGACFVNSASYVEVIVRTAILRSDGQVQQGERRFQLKMLAEFGSGVDVLR
jgi:type II secretory pathway pseudopilin PulG